VDRPCSRNAAAALRSLDGPGIKKPAGTFVQTGFGAGVS
jgi:hypothetical protein